MWPWSAGANATNTHSQGKNNEGTCSSRFTLSILFCFTCSPYICIYLFSLAMTFPLLVATPNSPPRPSTPPPPPPPLPSQSVKLHCCCYCCCCYLVEAGGSSTMSPGARRSRPCVPVRLSRSHCCRRPRPVKGRREGGRGERGRLVDICCFL